MARGKRRRRSFRSVRPGAPPGLHSVEQREGSLAEVFWMDYDERALDERALAASDPLPAPTGTERVTWIDVSDNEDLALLHRLGERYGLHPLLLEDMARPMQRPKMETYGEGRFVILRRFAHEGDLAGSQLALYFIEGLVLTVRERGDEGLEAIRDRLRRKTGLLRTRTADYLAYAIVDAVVDQHFPILEGISERIDRIEDRLMRDPVPSVMAEIHETRRDVIAILRSLWPLREAVSSLERDTGTLIRESTRPHLRDCHDHVLILSETLDSQREIVSGLTELYHTAVSHRTNEVMKVLTVVGSIFMPLGFLAGVYGMNFDANKSPWNMPELSFYWGYPMCIGLMFIVACGLLYHFWRHGWLTPRPFLVENESDGTKAKT